MKSLSALWNPKGQFMLSTRGLSIFQQQHNIFFLKAADSQRGRKLGGRGEGGRAIQGRKSKRYKLLGIKQATRIYILQHEKYSQYFVIYKWNRTFKIVSHHIVHLLYNIGHRLSFHSKLVHSCSGSGTEL